MTDRKLRFTAEDGTEYGEWEEKKLGEIAISLDNKRKPLNLSERKLLHGGAIPYYGANGIVDYVNQYLFNEPITLLAEDCGNYDKFATEPIAQFVLGKSWVNNHAHVLTAKKNLTTDEFLFYSLVHKDIRKHINGAGRAKLNKEDMMKIVIPLPSLPEQKKIAEFFSLLDDRISKQVDKVETFRQQKQGYAQKIFSQELKFHDDNGMEYPDWSQKSMSKIADIKMGFTPNTNDKSLWGGEIPWLSIRGLGEGKYIYEHTKTITSKAALKKTIVPSDTLIMSFKLTLGKLAITKKPLYTNEAICSFNWKSNDIDTEYMYYALSQINIASFGSRAVMGVTLNTDSLKSIMVSVPSFPEQEKIAEFLSTFDDKIDAEVNKLELLKEQKQGYMQRMFA